MPTTFFYADLPNGATAKRGSKTRTYTHCVAVKASAEFALHQAQAFGLRATYEKNWRWVMAQVAAGTDKYYTKGSEAAAPYEKYASAKEYADAIREQHIQAVYDAMKSGRFDRWDVVGWNGRIDLAQKLYQKEISNPANESAVILEVYTK